MLTILLLLAAFGAISQKKSYVNLIKSKNSTGIKLNGKDVIKVYEGTFQQDFSTLSADSAYFYPVDNAFDAFGHVLITQGDTLHIYSDKLRYEGNTKTATLTDNVKMVDKDATLTTNHLTYNTASRIGTYTNGGKLVNKENTLVSKNGYYFAYSRDSYFRYNVSLTSPDALVKTDTMRYNTGTRICYFYGPTHIYGTKGEKDRDTLYTENGYYNTVIEQAAFGKNNLYKTGTKSLKGDSLFYDKLKGYGRAVKRVTFNDKEQKVTIKGELGTYFKEEEHTIVTQDPFIILVTEQKDSTKTDSMLKRDTLKHLVKDRQLKDSTLASFDKKIMGDTSIYQKQLTAPLHTIPIKSNLLGDTLKFKQDSTIRKDSSQKLEINKQINNDPKAKPALKRKGIKKAKKAKDKKEATNFIEKSVLKDTSKVKTDSIYLSADTIETRILAYKDYKVYLEKQRIAHLIDTATKPKKIKKKEIKDTGFLTATYVINIQTDTSFLHQDYFGKPKLKPVKKKQAQLPSKKQLALDSIKHKLEADSIAFIKLNEPKDTARIRMVIMHHHAKLYKSDLQAKSDSMFYSTRDSTIRCFVNPIMWAEGSQLTGDTINLLMKHKKLDKLLMFPNGFIVNIEKADSLNFNQVSGKKILGYFKDDKLNKVFIEGNAESIYFNRDSGKTTINGMQRSLSTRISVSFKDNKASRLIFLTKPENKYSPLAKIKEDDKILKGFIWKPKERPISKESVLPSYGNKKVKVAEKSPLPTKKGTKAPSIKTETNLPKVDSIAKLDTAKKEDIRKAKPLKVIVVY